VQIRQDQRERRERQERQVKPKRKYRISARYTYNNHKWIDTVETGTFRQLWKKHGEDRSYEFYCADMPPHLDENGKYTTDQAYRLQDSNLIDYGQHKAWVDEELSRIAGKNIVLVWNAGCWAVGKYP
jgi:hypothetical protein